MTGAGGLRAAGDDLRRGGLTIRGLERMLGRRLRGGMLSIAHLGLVVSARGLPERPATLIKVFLGDGTAPWRDVERCFRRRSLAALVEIGALARDGDQAKAALRVIPFHDLCLLVDRPDVTAPTAVRDPDRSTSSLVPFVFVQRGDHAVDVGTGSGALAILAARRYRRVLAIDINPRAIELARWNAALAGAHIVAETCSPAPFDGLAERRYELALFAMPFLTAEAATGLHERSPSGDRIFEDVYAGLARVLAVRGRAALWHQIASAPGAFERRLAAVAGSDQLAVVWNGPITEGIGWEMGRALVARRTRGAAAAVRVPVPVNAEEGRLSDRQGPAEIARYVRTQRLLATADLDTLAPQVFAFVTAQRTSRVVAGRLRASSTVRVDELELAPGVLDLLEACDGRRTVRVLARRSGDPAGYRAAVRRLAEAGVIWLR